jgi:hypothetical protein
LADVNFDVAILPRKLLRANRLPRKSHVVFPMNFYDEPERKVLVKKMSLASSMSIRDTLLLDNVRSLSEVPDEV